MVVTDQRSSSYLQHAVQATRLFFRLSCSADPMPRNALGMYFSSSAACCLCVYASGFAIHPILYLYDVDEYIYILGCQHSSPPYGRPLMCHGVADGSTSLMLLPIFLFFGSQAHQLADPPRKCRYYYYYSVFTVRKSGRSCRNPSTARPAVTVVGDNKLFFARG